MFKKYISAFLNWFKSMNHEKKNVTKESNELRPFIEDQLTEFDPDEIHVLHEESATYPIALQARVSKEVVFTENITRYDRGVLENYFYDYAKPKLKLGLKNSIQINLPDRTLIPDYLYVDEGNSKFIVIEIDEPYALVNQALRPIHVKGEDEGKNKILIENGYSVIRFAEEQIARYPESCVHFIESFVKGMPVSQIVPSI